MNKSASKKIWWTPEEDRLLRQAYPVDTWPELLALFPRRSYSSIQNRASCLGISRARIGPSPLLTRSGKVLRQQEEFFIILEDRKATYAELPSEAREFPVENGFGYYGVMLYDPGEDRVQCHVCGRWYRSLGTHTFLAHGLTGDEYKETFELTQSTPLCCLGLSEMYRERAIATDLIGNVRNPKPWKEAPRPDVARLGEAYSRRVANNRHERNEKISQAKKALFQDEDRLKQQREYLDRAREKSIKATRGKKKSKEVRENLSRKLKGRQFRPETIERMKSAAQKRESEFREAGHNPRSPLTREVLVQVREMFDSGEYKLEELAELFGFGRETARKIVKKETWLDKVPQ